ncbi:MAG: hypothetical protein CL680_06710 [Blastomonas sp.]|jgi:type IV secretory pathway VirB2 component (pilin)|nr:hypothetical protein [Blastomonas sp.]|tara:strand:+ start:9530 stop:9895 length:366 start_codon:yes stop_codon:yes gene_type:complete
MGLADPFSAAYGSSALAAAFRWIEAALLGPMATSLAIVAVGMVGMGLMTGRLDLRRGALTIFGCFILFGAPNIVEGMLVASAGRATGFDAPQLIAAPIERMPTVAPPPAYDPYAAATAPIW